MTEPSIDIDRVVREVLAEMGLAPQGDSAPGPEPVDSSKVAQEQTEPDGDAQTTPGSEDGSLVISSRVVTLDDLGGRLDRVRRVIVSPGAVVTPAVRDELLRKNVSLVFEQRRPDPTPGTARLVLVTVGKSFDAAALVTALRNEGIDVDSRRSECLIATSDELAGELRDGNTLGVMLTSQPAIGVCLANRLAGVRAVPGGDAAETTQWTEAVGANLLVVAPRQRSFFQLKRTIGEFGRGGVRPCPELLNERLS